MPITCSGLVDPQRSLNGPERPPLRANHFSYLSDNYRGIDLSRKLVSEIQAVLDDDNVLCR